MHMEALIMRDGAPEAAAQEVRLALLSGEAALARAQSGAFQAGWRALLARCPWAAACQHPDFVLPWYRHYAPAVLPVLVLAEGADGSLAGLLTLGLRHGSRTLRGAGEQQAEYQAWLAAPEDGDAFIAAAVRALRQAFPGADLQLRYLPPGTPLGWLEAVDRKLLTLRPHRRPVMQAEPDAMARQRNKKNHRQNFNRLGRIGEVRFERVREHARFAGLFDALCMQYDFRQAALYRQMPFAADPAKRGFHLALHRQGLLHVTVLTVGGEPAASHLGLLSEGRALHIGILTHNPAFAAHSPGTLLLAMLGVRLAEEGVPMLDLTPGGDGYKEHFATGHDVAHALTVHGSARRRLAAELRAGLGELARQGLRKTGLRGTDLAAARDALRHGGAAGWLARLGRRLRARPCALRYRGQAGPGAGGLALARNRLADVFHFDARQAGENRWDFMGEVMRRMERGHDLYTVIRDDILVLSCWAQGKGGAEGEDELVVLSDLYVHRQHAGEMLLQAFFGQLLAQFRQENPGVAVAYRGRLDGRLRRALEGCGFVAEKAEKEEP